MTAKYLATRVSAYDCETQPSPPPPVGKANALEAAKAKESRVSFILLMGGRDGTD